jgi:hypothetical protein
MRRHNSGWIWAGRGIAVLIVAGLAIYLSQAGLDSADKLASVLGCLVAVIALLAPYLLPPPESPTDAPSISTEAAKPTQLVRDAAVGGNLTQVRNMTGHLRIQGASASAASPIIPPPARPVPNHEEPGGQSADGVWVGGNLSQIDGADGDATIG